MNKTVLIVDDDREFGTLLKGIFEQAGYTVHVAVDSDRALEQVQAEAVHLIVTDERLPGGLSGRQLIRKLRELNISVPIIMVSGFLNDDGIRELIRDGVAGVFMKPLNIFSLLKKASDLMEGRDRGPVRADGGASGGGASAVAGRRSIGQIMGLSDRGRQFVERAHDAASFKRNLLLIGPAGTLFEEIARDIVAIGNPDERCVILRPGAASAECLAQPFSGDPSDEALTFVILDAEHLAQEEVDRLVALADERGGASSPLRMIFCLQQSVEELFDAGSIDAEFYLFLGSSELRVPALKEMPEDMLAIARAAIEQQSEKAVFDVKLRSFLLDQQWPENMLELRSVIIRAVNLANPLPPQLRHFEAAMGADDGTSPEAEQGGSLLERFLREEKARYQSAVEILNLD